MNGSVVTHTTNNTPSGSTVTGTATCSAGKVVLGGGFEIGTTNGQLDRVQVQSSKPTSTNVWTAIGIVSGSNLSGNNRITIQAYAICSQ